MREVGGRHSTATHERARAKDASRRERDSSRREARRLALRWIREPSRRRDDVVGEGFRVRRERRERRHPVAVRRRGRGARGVRVRGGAFVRGEVAGCGSGGFHSRAGDALAAEPPEPFVRPRRVEKTRGAARQGARGQRQAARPRSSPPRRPRSPPSPPPVPVAKSDGELFYAQLLSQRRVFLNGRVDDKSAHSVIGKLLFLDAVDHEKPIILYINSGGGVVTSGLAIYDVMQHVRPPVYTVCLGHAESMAAVLLSAGERGHRWARCPTRAS